MRQYEFRLTASKEFYIMALVEDADSGSKSIFPRQLLFNRRDPIVYDGYSHIAG